jgi:hypothetical protein
LRHVLSKTFVVVLAAVLLTGGYSLGDIIWTNLAAHPPYAGNVACHALCYKKSMKYKKENL